MTARTPRFRHAALAIVVSGALLATACADGNPTSPSTGPAAGTSPEPAAGPTNGPSASSAAGIYRLASVNGRDVPCIFDAVSPAPGVTMEMRAMRGEIRLNDDGTYTQEFETQLRGSTLKTDIVNVREVVGTYVLQGATLALSPVGGTPFSPVYSAGRIDIVTDAPGLNGQMDRVTWTFRR